MKMSTSNYGASRGILGFSELVLWCGIGLGLILALVAGGAASSGFGVSGILAAIPGIAISVFCFVGVVMVQMAKAAVDTADYSYQMLSVARDQLAVSKQGLSNAMVAPTYSAQAQQNSGTTNEKATTTSQPAGTPFLQNANQQTFDHKGMRINRTIHGFLVEGRTFGTLDLAKNHVDAEHLKAELQGVRGAGN